MKENLGETSGSFVVKNTTWWNEEVKTIIKEKKKSYLAFGKCGNDRNLANYKEMKTKLIIAIREVFAK